MIESPGVDQARITDIMDAVKHSGREEGEKGEPLAPHDIEMINSFFETMMRPESTVETNGQMEMTPQAQAYFQEMMDDIEKRMDLSNMLNDLKRVEDDFLGNKMKTDAHGNTVEKTKQDRDHAMNAISVMRRAISKRINQRQTQ